MKLLYYFLGFIFFMQSLSIFGQQERLRHEFLIDSLINCYLYDECSIYIKNSTNGINQDFYLQYMYLRGKDSIIDNFSPKIFRNCIENKNDLNVSDFTYQMALMGFANFYHNSGDIESAIFWLKKGMSEFIEVYGKNDTNICIYYIRLSLYYYEAGEFEKFITYSEQVYSIYKDTGYQYDGMDEVLFTLTTFYQISEEIHLAINCLLELLNFETIGEIKQNYIYASLCSNYAKINDHDKYYIYKKKITFYNEDILKDIYWAEMYYLKNDNFIKETEKYIINSYGTQSYEYANFLGWNAFLRHEYMPTDICIAYLDKAEKILSSIVPQEKHLGLWMLLSSQYSYYNFVGKTLNIMLRIEKDIMNSKNIELINSFTHLKGNLLEKLGDVKGSISLNEHLLSIQKKDSTNLYNMYDILSTSDRIANLYYKNEQYEKTLEHYISTQHLRIELYGDTIANRTTFHNMSDCYLQLGKVDKAIKYAEKCISYHENNNDLITKISDFIHLGDCYLEKEDTVKAFKIFIIAKSLCKKIGTPKHYLEFRLRNSLIRYYAQTNNDDILYDILINQLEYEDSLARRELYKLEDNDRLHYWEENNDIHVAIPKYANMFINNGNLQELAYNTLITVKGKLLRISKEKSAYYDNSTNNIKHYNLNFIKECLTSNDIIIEFSEIYRDTTLYACVYRKDWKTPKVVNLPLNNINFEAHFPNYEGYSSIWEPLLPYILVGDHIYFSPSGILHQIPIESLPIGNGKVMSDVYHMHRVSSTQELAIKKDEVKYEKAVLYGNLNYEMTNDEMIAESRVQYGDNKNYFVSRGLLEDSIRGYVWTTLSNTEREVDYISDLLNKNQVTTTTYQQNKGNEESFKALSGKGYNIIHLATHGFFYPDKVAKEKDYFKPTFMNTTSTYHPDFSMWRSGLVLSGGNRAWKGDTIPNQVEDGILKAQEISDLDLQGADLVVLSACQTGLGEITSDGVFGLQRAFKMAGAQTIVMSLTEVDDQTTMTMMNKFYTNLFSGQSKHDAFYNAQRYIRSIKPDPKYWAGWIMLD